MEKRTNTSLQYFACMLQCRYELIGKIKRTIQPVEGKTMNKTTVALTNEQYQELINLTRNGYNDSSKHRGNNRIATALVTQANLGCRIGDILQLKLSDIIKDGDRYRLNTTEDKTGKPRTFTVHPSIYNYLLEYSVSNGIKPTARLFPISVRAVEKHLKALCEHLGIENVSTHSFRKMYATRCYMESGMDVELVRQLLQHSNVADTQRYIGISNKRIEETLSNSLNII